MWESFLVLPWIRQAAEETVEGDPYYLQGVMKNANSSGKGQTNAASRSWLGIQFLEFALAGPRTQLPQTVAETITPSVVKTGQGGCLLSSFPQVPRSSGSSPVWTGLGPVQVCT